MQDAQSGQYASKSDVNLLPIVDLNPSDTTCIYSTLLYVESQANNLNIVTPCITFDQPLWIKAMDIIKNKSMNIVCRLGVFHTLMSFMGSIGKMLKGSGLEESLETVYGENVVQHMMTGKAVSRALRGHFLVEAALMNMLISNFIPQELTVDDIIELEEKEYPENENSNEREQSEEENMLEEEQDSSSCDYCSDNAPVVSEKVFNKEEIANLIQLYELVKNGRPTGVDIEQSKELLKLERNLKEYRQNVTVKYHRQQDYGSSILTVSNS